MAARLQTLDSAGLHGPAAPAGGWRRVAVDWITVSGATAVCHGLGVVTSLLLKVLLNPAQMGVWQALKMLLSYGNYANLGVSKGAVRDYAVALGRGETAEAKRGLDLAFTVGDTPEPMPEPTPGPMPPTSSVAIVSSTGSLPSSAPRVRVGASLLSSARVAAESRAWSKLGSCRRCGAAHCRSRMDGLSSR